jgi:multidrug efflux pump subunit AcrB
MLPFEDKPWAKRLAATVIAVSIIGAICIPIILLERKALDVPIVVGIVLLLLGLVPPNVLILIQKPGDAEKRRAAFRQAIRWHLHGN